MVIPDEIDYRLDRLLEDWWLYVREYRDAPAGLHASSIYADVESGMRGGSAEEMLEGSVDRTLMDAVDGSVASLNRDHQHAIDVRMLNAFSCAAWRSNRVGKQIDDLYAEAKTLLLPLLRKRRVEI